MKPFIPLSAPPQPITGIADAEKVPGVVVYHAGTRRQDDTIQTAGGRVLSVTALADTIESARARALEAVSRIHFQGMQHRRDIGL